jgi:hypothetical protein
MIPVPVVIVTVVVPFVVLELPFEESSTRVESEAFTLHHVISAVAKVRLAGRLEPAALAH